MLRTYLTRRLLSGLPVLLGVSILVFVMMRLIPGDVVDRILGSEVGLTEERRAELRRLFGIDRPLHIQYLDWISHVVRGDLGISLLNRRPVFDDLLLRVPVTLELAMLSLLIAVMIGIPLGVLSASRRYQWPDYLGSFFALVGVSIPNFWLATMLILVLSLGLGWFPSAGYIPFAQDPWQNLKLMVLPATALGIAEAAALMRMVRSATLEVLQREYVRTAQAKGLTELRVLMRHVLANALIPVLTVVGLSSGYLLAGTIIIEGVFSIPGVGRFALMGIMNRDYPVIQGAILFIAFVYFLINLIIDLLYGVVDPRIHYS
jgi:peptide/nickel transport system permease protein